MLSWSMVLARCLDNDTDSAGTLLTRVKESALVEPRILR